MRRGRLTEVRDFCLVSSCKYIFYVSDVGVQRAASGKALSPSNGILDGECGEGILKSVAAGLSKERESPSPTLAVGIVLSTNEKNVLSCRD